MQSRHFERRFDHQGYLAEHVPQRVQAEGDGQPRPEDASTFSQQPPKTGRKEVDCGDVFWTWALRRS